MDANGNRLQLPPWKGGYLDGHYRVTFCGFFPFDNPRYTCIVVINDPQMPYRGPAVSSGTVLKNLALKMYARGMLEGDPVFRPDGFEITFAQMDSSQKNAISHRGRAMTKLAAILACRR